MFKDELSTYLREATDLGIIEQKYTKIIQRWSVIVFSFDFM